ncbi:hypothetical protein OH76DRAFT_104 [Lentinus brumalis]|uniref:Uncharacterized protein n=1 Tax=Lentinus brumalis TaxID=2498619 RepID=A0A371DWJ2_9APHY|nr:hypothetical protein OH76DRAFT_104 [Polyporus brumalis]
MTNPIGDALGHLPRHCGGRRTRRSGPCVHADIKPCLREDGSSARRASLSPLFHFPRPTTTMLTSLLSAHLAAALDTRTTLQTE